MIYLSQPNYTSVIMYDRRNRIDLPREFPIEQNLQLKVDTIVLLLDP